MEGLFVCLTVWSVRTQVLQEMGEALQLELVICFHYIISISKAQLVPNQNQNRYGILIISPSSKNVKDSIHQLMRHTRILNESMVDETSWGK